MQVSNIPGDAAALAGAAQPAESPATQSPQTPSRPVVAVVATRPETVAFASGVPRGDTGLGYSSA